MFKLPREGMIFKGKKEKKLIILVLVIGLLLCSGKFRKTANSYYSGGFFNGLWNSPFVMSNFNNTNFFNTSFLNTGFSPNYGTFGTYGSFPGSYNMGFNPGYGIFNGYGGFLNSYNPGFGLNYGQFGSYGVFPGPYFSGFGYNYGGFFPGGFGGPYSSPQWPFNRPVSSDDPLPPPQNSLDPRPGDEDLVRGNVYLRETQIYILESYPMQVRMELKGDLPTPCHQLRAKVSDPDNQDRIHIELYSLVEPDLNCIQVLEPFEETISLGSFTGGSYTVWVNGEQVEDLIF